MSLYIDTSVLVGENEIHAPARHRPHKGNAVALEDHIAECPMRAPAGRSPAPSRGSSRS
ncbi:hypothetical protein [Kozakia baliensis]|uniref:hypothetical protein n=1 Tax=Kozakia baliensis TaxID=153496 RepID=UPI001649D09A